MMRVATETRVVQAAPGTTVDIVVDVANTSDLIDGVTAELIGLPGATTVVEPKVLPLFPSAQGQITLSVQVPTTQPAGLHPVTVEVVSHAGDAVRQHVDVELSVSAQPGVRLSRTPQTLRSRRSGRFVLEVANTGNTALHVALDAVREDTRTTARFTPRTLRVDPGVTAPAILVLKGPRMLTGAEVDRSATVNLVARRTNTIAAMQETEHEPELTTSTTVVLKQRPILSRGLLTALVLLLIVGLWASVFLLGLTQVLSGDPLTKTAPASFFPASAETAGSSSDASGEDGAGGGAEGTEGEAGGDAAAEPAGAVSKSGLMAAGVGGTITGTVTADSNLAPVQRILVEAFRDGREGPVLVSSAATQDDGSYTLAGLFPTEYRLRFSATGFDTVWYPAARARGGSTPVGVQAQGKVEGIDAVVAGQDASISGTVDWGSDTATVIEVTARPRDITDEEGQPLDVVARATTDATGAYTLTGLPAPATYDLTFTAEGYAATTVSTQVSGGESRLQPSVVPSSEEGSIAGLVTDGRDGLGGVTVSTTVDGESVAVITPTVGVVGQFTLAGLPTPGTYVLTFAADGHGSATQIVDIGAGGTVADLEVDLVKGTGSISGRLVDGNDNGLGGATVTVGGAGSLDGTVVTPTTTTLTDGIVGSFSLSGLQAPGDYTLTFSLDGYSPQSVPVHLGASGPTDDLTVTLATRLGELRGVVNADGAAYVGAVVSATNGAQTWPATTGTGTDGGGLPRGGYRITGLPPGTYSVTVTVEGLVQQTARVRVDAGVVSTQRFFLGDEG